jgi:hypothetical protein
MVKLFGGYMKKESFKDFLIDRFENLNYFYVCDGLLFDSYQRAVDYANDQFRKLDIALNIERVVKV